MLSFVPRVIKRTQRTFLSVLTYRGVEYFFFFSPFSSGCDKWQSSPEFFANPSGWHYYSTGLSWRRTIIKSVGLWKIENSNAILRVVVACDIDKKKSWRNEKMNQAKSPLCFVEMMSGHISHNNKKNKIKYRFIKSCNLNSFITKALNFYI